ncbi:MAG: hypothetical protein NT052_02060 [Candidatus Shapirobacteria bacterium]|nr:hypothetical protein [Candidatus Shapirobacteria bacterium]
MLSTSHSLISALIVSRIFPPQLSLPLVLASHYLLDIVPHWDTGTGLTNGHKSKKKAVLETLVDVIVGFSLVFIFFQKGKPFSPLLWVAVFLGILPDLLEFPALFFGKRPFPINVLEKFHNTLHQRAKLPWGLIYQIVVLIIVFTLFY